MFVFMDKDNRTVNINLRVTQGEKDRLQRLAEEGRRSLSDYIRLQLEKLISKDKK